MPADALSIKYSRRSENCRIIIEEKLLSRLSKLQSLFSKSTSIAIVTDDVVGKLYADQVKDQLSEFSKTSVITFRHGEQNKTLDTCDAIASKMSDRELDRKSIVVALGGGVVGDVVGFTSSIFKRGIDYVQVPTTLLAQVDSSIGGKTGVDTNWGKNQLGTFYQPKAVLIDTSTLNTLPTSEVINGLGEMVKSGVIADRNLFNAIEELESLDAKSLIPLIPRTCAIKASTVRRDEYEENLRSTLNYGHTIAHALESSSEFKLSHGKAVILGMMAEGWISNRLGFFATEDFRIQKNLLRRIIRSYRIQVDITARKVMKFVKLDKKAARSTIRMVLPERIGKMHTESNGNYLVPVTEALALESLRYCR